jgi:hypothetical protein
MVSLRADLASSSVIWVSLANHGEPPFGEQTKVQSTGVLRGRGYRSAMAAASKQRACRQDEDESIQIFVEKQGK